MAQPHIFFFFFIILLSFTALSTAYYNIVNLGADPNGNADSAPALHTAWTMACRSRKSVTIFVPEGNYFVSEGVFQGPCKNNGIKFLIKGTIFAPWTFSNDSLTWLYFKDVDGVSIYGGYIYGRGQKLYACKLTYNMRCPVGAASLTFSRSKNVLISGLKATDSKSCQISILDSTNVKLRNTTILAESYGPDTMGIQIKMSNNVSIVWSTIEAGDNCISVKAGSTNVRIQHIICQGFGVSIGSLGDVANEAGVENITVSSVNLSGGLNGLKILTWGRPSSGFVKGVKFEHAIMNNAGTPIIIDQNYCPRDTTCLNQTASGIKISGVTFNDIQGTSISQLAMKFDCSSSNPCRGIRLHNINLTYGLGDQPTQSFCRNAEGRSSGLVVPPSCLS